MSGKVIVLRARPALLILLLLVAPTAASAYQVTVSVVDFMGAAVNNSRVQFTHEGTTVNYATGASDNQVTITCEECAYTDAVRIKASHPLVNPSMEGETRYVICDGSHSLSITIGISVALQPYPYTEPACCPGAARTEFSTPIGLTTDNEGPPQLAQSMRYSAHFDPESLHVLNVVPLLGCGFHDVQCEWNNEEGYLTYYCYSDDPGGEPVPGPGEPVAYVAMVEVALIASLDPCGTILISPYDPASWGGGRQAPPPSTINGIAAMPSEMRVTQLAPASVPGFPGTEPAMVLEVSGASPNPFRNEIVIGFSLREETERLKLQILDVNGRLVRELAAGRHRAGSYQEVWGGTDLYGVSVPDGIYFLRLKAGAKTAISRVVLVR
jgi:hypothetical protein